MPFQIKRAARRALPIQAAFVGPSNSGKTLSGILFGAGLLELGQRLVIIDTEKGRANLYADNKRVLEALPDGFDVIELDAPYHPRRFIEAIDTAENAGYKVGLIDSASDSWDGPGGCSDIAEKNKNMWNEPKLWNKRLMTRLALSDMHTICCLKAQEKTKILDKAKSGTGKQEYIDLGMQPICEKNFFYPMTLAFSVDPETHLCSIRKMHDDLREHFLTPHLFTKRDGDIVRQWNNGAQKLSDNEQLIKRSRDAAEQGVARYREFFQSLTAVQRKALGAVHEENKKNAEQVDAIPAFGSADAPVEWPDGFDGQALIWNGKHLAFNEETGNYSEVSHAAVA